MYKYKCTHTHAEYIYIYIINIYSYTIMYIYIYNYIYTCVCEPYQHQCFDYLLPKIFGSHSRHLLPPSFFPTIEVEDHINGHRLADHQPQQVRHDCHLRLSADLNAWVLDPSIQGWLNGMKIGVSDHGGSPKPSILNGSNFG